MAKSSKRSERIAAVRAADDRPIVGVVGMDVAGTKGVCGLCVVRLDGRDRDYYHGSPMDARTFRWLGDCVARMCRPGERLVFAAESDAFGPSIGRKLGIGVGAIEGLLTDLNAIAPDTRLDVASVTWRTFVGIERGAGRQAAKSEAMRLALPMTGGVLVDANAAEAIHIAEWARAMLAPEAS